MITLAYKELIGKFSMIRDYVREFYIFGFKSRGEVGEKSSRSYDDKRRQIESWLGDYMSFKQSSAGRAQYISVDSREVIHNPLYEAFKTSTFSVYDVLLHFCLLDMLTEEDEKSIRDIADTLQTEYFNLMGNNLTLDEKTVRNKLNDYVELGVLSRKKGKRKQDFYSLAMNRVNLISWYDAIEFFSETNPIGVIGSFLLDKKELSKEKSCFWYKHHYMLYAMDSEILEVLLGGITEKRYVEVVTTGKKRGKNKIVVYPIKIYVSTQNGREYLLCHENGGSGLEFIRLDKIISAKLHKNCDSYQEYANEYLSSKPYLWGVISGSAKDIVHVEMTIRVQENEDYMIKRLEREKRNGQIFKLSDRQYKYVVDTYDAMELMPWIRTFIGRIEKLESSNPCLEEKFKEDMECLYSMYFGEDGNAV